jgi:hypothetical protein
MAQEAKTPFQRTALLDIASKWLLLAGGGADTKTHNSALFGDP